MLMCEGVQNTAITSKKCIAVALSPMCIFICTPVQCMSVSGEKSECIWLKSQTALSGIFFINNAPKQNLYCKKW